MLALRTAQGLSLTDFVRYSISSSFAREPNNKSGLDLASEVDERSVQRMEEVFGAARSVIQALLPYVESRHVEIYAVDGDSSGMNKQLITLTPENITTTKATSSMSVSDITDHLRSILLDDSVTSNVHSNTNTSAAHSGNSSIDYRICLTDPKGFLLSNTVISAVFRVLAGGTGD